MADTETRLPEEKHPPAGCAKLTREEEAKLALENTAVSPAVARVLVIFFVVTIFSVPVVQHVAQAQRYLAAKRDGAADGVRLLPEAYDVFGLLPSIAELKSAHSLRQAWDLLPIPSEIRSYESALEDSSVVSGWIRPRAQYLLARLGGVGNEQAYLGRDGWLYYRPEVDYLTHPGFLQPSSLAARAMQDADNGSAVQPNPLPAIIQFRRQLAARGIDLVLVPTPCKPMLLPEKLTRRYKPSAQPLQNPSYPAFLRALRRAGVKVFDPTHLIANAARKTATSPYLRTDTHWTPEAMDLAAAGLAAFVQRQCALPPRKPVSYVRRPVRVSGVGDIARMLSLPPGQRMYPPQTVVIRQVFTQDGRPWQPDRGADILLLGDSFSNIYSLGGMGWGTNAGLPQQLGFHIQRPIDRIVINAGGSYTTRERLREELARGRDRLRGKRLVIWQFAMRDLLSGDWRVIDLPTASHRSTMASATAPAAADKE